MKVHKFLSFRYLYNKWLLPKVTTKNDTMKNNKATNTAPQKGTTDRY